MFCANTGNQYLGDSTSNNKDFLDFIKTNPLLPQNQNQLKNNIAPFNKKDGIITYNYSNQDNKIIIV